MKPIEQIRLWVDGESVHNDETDECCPDFSCCKPENIASVEERKAFLQATLDGDESKRMGMLGMFLSKALSDKKVHIVGFEYE